LLDLPVFERVFQSGDAKQLTVPASDATRLFRLK
jgi:hypothetical protein